MNNYLNENIEFLEKIVIKIKYVMMFGIYVCVKYDDRIIEDNDDDKDDIDDYVDKDYEDEIEEEKEEEEIIDVSDKEEESDEIIGEKNDGKKKVVIFIYDILVMINDIFINKLIY